MGSYFLAGEIWIGLITLSAEASNLPFIYKLLNLCIPWSWDPVQIENSNLSE